MASKSLGTLTLDLVARTGGFVQGMDKAERSSAKWRKKVERDLDKASKQMKAGLAMGAAAAATAFAGLTAATVKYTRDGLKSVDAQMKLARSLDTTYDSVTALKMAFSDSGIDNFEASMNRLNRRLGAAELGRGSAVKAVEELNLNLSELSNLEADQRVAAIADRIKEVAGNSQQAARYAQDLGFEQKEAAAFFLQGGDAIRGYRDELEALGLSMSELDAIKIEQANDAFARTGMLTQALSQQMAKQFSPILTALSNQFVDAAKEAGGLEVAVGDAFNGVIDATGFVLDAIEGIDRTFEVVGSGFAVTALGIKEVLLTMAREVVEIPTKAVNELIEVLNNLPKVNIEKVGMSDLGKQLQGEIVLTQEAIALGLQDIHNILMEPLPSHGLKKFVADAREAANESAQTALEIQRTMGGALGGLEGEDTVTDEMEKRRHALLASLETEKQAILRAYGERDAEITELREAQRLTEMEADNARIQNERAKYQALDAMRQEDIEREKEAVNARLSAAADIVSITSTQMSQMQDLYGDMGAVGKAFFVMSQALAAANAVIQGIQAGMAIRVAYAQMAAMAGPAAPGILAAGEAHANLSQAMGVAAAAGIAAQTIASFEGGGYTGAGPRAGGLDGKGGFMAMLHPDETVIDHTMKKVSGGSANITVNLYEDNSRAGQVEQRQRPDGGTDVNVFVSDIMSNGPRSKALENAYGLRRQGR